MKRRISFNLFCTVVWRSICQVFLFVGSLFGLKGKSCYAKVIWRIFAGCLTLLLLLQTISFCYRFAEDVIADKWENSFAYMEVYESENISPRILFQKTFDSPKGRLYDKRTDKVILKDVDWVVTSQNHDSLAVFSKNGKRGYINRFDGTVAIPLTYSKAWVFSDGLAAVEKKGELLFIDHEGKEVIKTGFEADDGYNMDYVFEDGFCIIRDAKTNELGLIDKSGNWALSPIYDNISHENGFWQVIKDNRVGLFKADLAAMFPVTNTAIYVYNDVIEVRQTDHIARRYDFAGNVVSDFVIDDIENLYFEVELLRQNEEKNEDNFENLKMYDVATCQKYMVYDGISISYYGLIDRKGKRLTPPTYTDITAVSKDLYLCQPDGVLINSRGQIVK